MDWVIRLIGTTIVAFVLLKIFYTAQQYAESEGKKKSLWISVLFLGLWCVAFFICTGLLFLILWVGIHMYMENDFKGALSMVITVLLVGPSHYILFIYPLQKRRKEKIERTRKE